MFDIPNTNNKQKNNNLNKPSIVESLNEKFYDNALLNNVEKLCKEIFQYDFERIKDNNYGYCGWIFPNGTVLDTNYSTHHFLYEKKIKELLGEDINFLKLGLIRYNIKEGLLEFPYTPITEQQLKVLDYVFNKYFKDCQFKFGNGGTFIFGDNYKQNMFNINPNIYEEEYPFELLYKRNGEDMSKLIRNYCYTGKIEENIK